MSKKNLQIMGMLSSGMLIMIGALQIESPIFGIPGDIAKGLLIGVAIGLFISNIYLISKNKCA